MDEILEESKLCRKGSPDICTDVRLDVWAKTNGHMFRARLHPRGAVENSTEDCELREGPRDPTALKASKFYSSRISGFPKLLMHAAEAPERPDIKGSVILALG